MKKEKKKKVMMMDLTIWMKEARKTNENFFDTFFSLFLFLSNTKTSKVSKRKTKPEKMKSLHIIAFHR